MAIYEEASKIEDDRVRAEVMTQLDLDREYVLSLGRVTGCAYVIFLASKAENPELNLAIRIQIWIASVDEVASDRRIDIVLPASISVLLLERAGFRDRLASFARRVEAAIAAEPVFLVRSATNIGSYDVELVDSLSGEAGDAVGDRPMSVDELNLFKNLTRDLKIDGEEGK